MNGSLNGLPQAGVARLAGYLYLGYIVTFALSSFIQGKPIVWEDAGVTAKTIMASQGVFRFGIALELIAALLFLLTAWALYVLFQVANRNLALLFLLLNLVGVGIECVYTLIHFAALTFYTGSENLVAFKPDQLQTLGLLFLKIGGEGNKVSVLFYGAWLFPLGYLALKSRLLPKIFGILLLLDATSLTMCFLQLWFLPAHEEWTYPLFPIMFIAECGLGLWLAIKGVGEPRNDTNPADLEPIT